MKNVLIISGHPDLSTSVAEETETPIMCSVNNRTIPTWPTGWKAMPIKPSAKATPPRRTLRLIRKKRRRVDDAPATAKN